jgi:two-component system NtrC family sensor kinase
MKMRKAKTVTGTLKVVKGDETLRGSRSVVNPPEPGLLESHYSRQERLASLGILAAGVAHEINSPLAALQAWIKTLKGWGKRSRNLSMESRAELFEIVNALEQSSQSCSEITAKLLLLAQPIQVAHRWTDVNRIASDTLVLLAHKTRLSGIEVIEDLDPELPRIWARESGMRSVCMNICLNAVQAMTEGGELTVRTRRLEDGWVELSFSDTGPGIPEDIQKKIWDPFFTTKPTGLGTGLGLSVTYGIVKRHGGTIQVESRPGSGARFTVCLPVGGPGTGEGR